MPKARSKKKPFINKKDPGTVTFALVHRSQKDPLAADDEAPQFVLQPVVDRSELCQKRKEEERKCGVFYDDDYDYLQHLKDRQHVQHDWQTVDRFLIERGKPLTDAARKTPYNLPSSVFASEKEESEGLLNKAAPRSGPLFDWDPDIVERLDDDFQGHERVFTLNDVDADGDDDDFDAMLAEAQDPDGDDLSCQEDEDEDEEEEASDDFDSDEANDDVPSLDGGFSFAGEETRSKFTNYSMSSSVIRRNSQLSLLDDKFDQFFDSYNEENIGGLECEDIEGAQPERSSVMDLIVSQFEKDLANQRQPLDSVSQDPVLGGDESCSSSSEDLEPLVIQHKAEGDWDCQSILSTYSNLYNHPKMIAAPKRAAAPILVCERTGMPKDVLGKGLTAGALHRLDLETGVVRHGAVDDDDRTMASRVSQLSIRSKHETLEEKRTRKKNLRLFRQERRQEKKGNRLAFAMEKERQEKLQVAQSLHQARAVRLL